MRDVEYNIQYVRESRKELRRLRGLLNRHKVDLLRAEKRVLGAKLLKCKECKRSSRINQTDKVQILKWVNGHAYWADDNVGWKCPKCQNVGGTFKPRTPLYGHGSRHLFKNGDLRIRIEEIVYTQALPNYYLKPPTYDLEASDFLRDVPLSFKQP